MPVDDLCRSPIGRCSCSGTCGFSAEEYGILSGIDHDHFCLDRVENDCVRIVDHDNRSNIPWCRKEIDLPGDDGDISLLPIDPADRESRRSVCQSRAAFSRTHGTFFRDQIHRSFPDL